MNEHELELWRAVYVAALQAGETRQAAAECAVHADMAVQEYRRRFYNRHTRGDEYGVLASPRRVVTVELYADRLAREEQS